MPWSERNAIKMLFLRRENPGDQTCLPCSFSVWHGSIYFLWKLFANAGVSFCLFRQMAIAFTSLTKPGFDASLIACKPPYPHGGPWDNCHGFINIMTVLKRKPNFDVRVYAFKNTQHPKINKHTHTHTHWEGTHRICGWLWTSCAPWAVFSDWGPEWQTSRCAPLSRLPCRLCKLLCPHWPMTTNCSVQQEILVNRNKTKEVQVLLWFLYGL